MHVTLLNPPILDRKYNFTYSVDIPLGLAYIASYLIEKKIAVTVIDALGDGLKQRRAYKKDLCILGLTDSEILGKIDPKTDLIGFPAKYCTQHNIVLDLIRTIKRNFPHVPIVIGGNDATYNPEDFLDAGADYILFGESEISMHQLCMHLDGKLSYDEIGGIMSSQSRVQNKRTLTKNIDIFPMPARELFPLEKYYEEKSAFGPVNTRYTAITTSRGCPFECSFCSSAVFWNRSWRPRSPKAVVDELQYCIEHLGIEEFHFIDDNFTLNKKRAMDICKEILDRGLKFTWGAPNGLRPENIDEELLDMLQATGCTNITLAPENGSPRLLKEILKKRVSLEKIRDIVEWSNKRGIRTSAYMIIGSIGETKKDRRLNSKYARTLARAGLDDLGVFPLVPYPEVPIAALYKKYNTKENFEDLITGVVPEWYPNRRSVKNYKSYVYLTFFLTQIMYHPGKVIRLIANFVRQKQDTKSDRVIKNMLRLIFKSGSYRAPKSNP